MDFEEFAIRLKSLDLNKVVQKSIEESDGKKWISSKNRNQLWDGIGASGRELSPTYLTDPYFKTPAQAKAYMNWKWAITRNSKRSKEVPNLYINGYFYKSIETQLQKEYAEIETTTGLGKEIIGKFTDALGLTKENIDLLAELIKDKFTENVKNEILR